MATASVPNMVQVVVEDAVVEESSIILTSASPVFLRMITSGMRETESGRVELTGKSKSEFEAVMKFLRPRTARSMRIATENVDFLVKWFDEYEMMDLKNECEEFLMGLPCTTDRLMQAHRFSLRRQYDRCLKEIGDNFESASLEHVAAVPEIIKELVPLMQQSVKSAKRRLEVKTSELEAIEAKRARTKEALSNFRRDLVEQSAREGGYTIEWDSVRDVDRSIERISVHFNRCISTVLSRIDA
jgi:hypothetical protein